MRILIITREHPPGNSARRVQVGRLLQGLRQQGVEVTVITAQTPNAPSSTEDTIRLPLGEQGQATNLLGRVTNVLKTNIDEVNPRNAWISAAIVAAKKQIDRKRPDAILTISWPFHSHMVGLALREQYPALPWAAFLSDPSPAGVIGGFWKRYQIPGIYQYQLRKTQHLFERADQILMSNPYAADVYRGIMPDALLDSVSSIWHCGPEVSKATEIDQGWLTHIGSIDPHRCCEPLLKAIRSVAEHDATFKGLRLVGKVVPKFIEQAREHDVEDLLDIVGFVSPEEAQSICQRSRGLLLIEPDLPKSFFVASKFSECVAVERPVFAISPPTSTIRNLFQQHPIGIAATWHDSEMSEKLRQFWTTTEDYRASDFKALQHIFSTTENAKLLVNVLATCRP